VIDLLSFRNIVAARLCVVVRRLTGDPATATPSPILMRGRCPHSLLLACVGAVVFASSAQAATSRVAVLGKDGVPILRHLERNARSSSLDVALGTVWTCSREVVTLAMNELLADAALCADGDTIGIWGRDGERVVLQTVIVDGGGDEHEQQVTATRATTALGQRSRGRDAESGNAGVGANSEGSPTTKDAPAPRAPRISARTAPRLVLGLGPAIVASRHGSSLAISAEAQIAFGRHVAVVPWISFVPENRPVERPEGAASFRPTIFGFGFALPMLAPSSWIVPRVGGGYGVLWLHVSPETAAAGAVMRKPEDLLAPLAYGTAAISIALGASFRVTGEAFAGLASHDLVVRIAGQSAANWGVPLGGLALRAEWVLP
jgi:hypothetical protein